jgi:hypothetical protein
MTSSTDQGAGLDAGPDPTPGVKTSLGEGTAGTDGGDGGDSTASTAVDRGRDVAATAASEAKDVAGEAAARAKDVLGDARTQVAGHLDEQSRTQKDRLVDTLHGVGDDLDSMAGSGTEAGLASDLVGEASRRTRELTDWLETRDPGQLLDDVRGFARRRPGTFLLGALVAGVVVGRLARGAREAQQDDAPSGSSTTTPVTAPVTETTPPTSQTSPAPALPAEPEPIGSVTAPGGTGGHVDPLVEGAHASRRPDTGGGPA